MSSKRLNTETVSNLPFTTTGQKHYYDTVLKGFGLRVSTARKTYFVETKICGKTIRRTLKHPHPQISTELARRDAQKLLVGLRDGKDPREEQRKAVTAKVTFKEAAETYLTSRDLKPRTLKDYRVAIDDYLRAWASLPLVSISKAMVSDKHLELGVRSKAQANLAMRFARAVFNFAIEKYEPYVQINPIKRLSALKSWYRIDPRKSYIERHKMKPWFDAVESMETTSDKDNRSTFRDYFLVLLFTGYRRAEGTTLLWENVDLMGKAFTIIDPKNGEDHTLPMSEFLFDMFTRRKATATSRYVFPRSEARLSNEEDHPIMDPRKANLYICRESGVDFRPHDLRRTFASVAASLKVPDYAIKQLLNHKTKSVTEDYIILDLEERRTFMEQISAEILRRAGRSPSAEIIPFPKQA